MDLLCWTKWLSELKIKNKPLKDRIAPYDRHTWRSGMRSAIRAASQLPGRGPTDVDVALYPDVNQKSVDDEDDDDHDHDHDDHDDDK